MNADNRAKYGIKSSVASLGVIKSDELDEKYFIAGYDQVLKKGYLPLTQEEFMKRFPPSNPEYKFNDLTIENLGENRISVGSNVYGACIKHYSKEQIYGFIKIFQDYVIHFHSNPDIITIKTIHELITKINQDEH